MNHKKELSVKIVLVSLFAIGVMMNCNFVFANNTISAEDQVIIDAGVKLAKKLGKNPVPICGGDTGYFIPGGYKFSIVNNRFSVVNGDLVLNASRTDYKVFGVEIMRGEYVIIKDDKAVKGKKKLVSD